MNFEEVVRAHLAWKTKLRLYTIRQDRSLIPKDIAADNQCELGKWIYAEGLKHKASAEYAALKPEHAKFHKLTAQIVEKVNAGEVKEAEELLKPGGEFAKTSSEIVKLLMQLKRKAD